MIDYYTFLIDTFFFGVDLVSPESAFARSNERFLSVWDFV